MLDAQAGEAEAILWKLLRARQQRAELARRIAERESDCRPSLAEHFRPRARSTTRTRSWSAACSWAASGHFDAAA